MPAEPRTAFRREPAWYLALVSLLAAAFVGLTAWNLPRYDWLGGYDAFAHARYVDVLAREHRLPAAWETTEWHTPPGWHVVAGLAQQLDGSGADPDQRRPGQAVAAGAGLLLALTVLALARELWPRRRRLHLIALGLVLFSPAFVRASVMYHPETLSTSLAALGVLLSARALRGGAGLWPAVASGIAFGAGALTRAWVWPVAAAALVALAAAAVRDRRPRAWLRPLACAAATLVLAAPWLAHQAIEYGNPFAFNRPAQSPFGSRSWTFFLGPGVLDAFDRPIPPNLRNEIVPQLYADWWGDFFLTWDVDPELAAQPLLIPDSIVTARARQSFAGLLPTLLCFGGVLALGRLAVRRRDWRLAPVPLSAGLFGVAFLGFQLRYPVPDADTIKGTYALCALPALALGGAFAADVLARWSRIAAIGLVVAAAAIMALQAPFLIL